MCYVDIYGHIQGEFLIDSKDIPLEEKKDLNTKQVLTNNQDSTVN